MPAATPPASADLPTLSTFVDDVAVALDARLAASEAARALSHPGNAVTRQPVHTVYVPATAVTADLCREWGDAALALLDRAAPDTAALGSALDGAVGVPTTGEGWEALVAAVRAKLATEPVEDLRIDAEDGLGAVDDATEDEAVRAAARHVLTARAAGRGPAFFGLRFKSFENATRARGVRSLLLFLDEVLGRAGQVPEGLRLTFPKVTTTEQVEALVWTLDRVEARLGLAAGALRFEIQVETPQAILGPDGRHSVARWIQAAGGRVSGLHYGTYDYSAALGVPAAYQSMRHPVADVATSVMQVAVAGTGVELSHGSTNRVPEGDDDAVREAWRLHAALVRRSLERGIYQGWDLHPGQLVTRFATVFGFYREAFAAAAPRLAAYHPAETAGKPGGDSVLDEPATVQAMSAVVVRGLGCGAVGPAEAEAATGLSVAELRRWAARRVG